MTWHRRAQRLAFTLKVKLHIAGPHDGWLSVGQHGPYHSLDDIKRLFIPRVSKILAEWDARAVLREQLGQFEGNDYTRRAYFGPFDREIIELQFYPQQAGGCETLRKGRSRQAHLLFVDGEQRVVRLTSPFAMYHNCALVCLRVAYKQLHSRKQHNLKFNQMRRTLGLRLDCLLLPEEVGKIALQYFAMRIKVFSMKGGALKLSFDSAPLDEVLPIAELVLVNSELQHAVLSGFKGWETGEGHYVLMNAVRGETVLNFMTHCFF